MSAEVCMRASALAKKGLEEEPLRGQINIIGMIAFVPSLSMK
jgi:hypothetical protein